MRYAVYWAPEPEHPLWFAGCEWLGRDPLAARRTGSGEPSGDGKPARIDVSEPFRYGFHATLKAPFKLRLDAQPRDFLRSVAALAASTKCFPVPELKVDWLQDFLALRPTDALRPSHPLQQLADRCVRELDSWRRGPTLAEIEARVAGIDPDSRLWTHALRWGYPYVFDHWRFHMTLSNSMPGDLADRHACSLHDAAAEHFADALATPLHCRSLSVFTESEPGEPFILAHRFELSA